MCLLPLLLTKRRNTEMRRCSICKQLKDDAEFAKDRTRHDGISPKCRDCQHSYNQKYWRENREKYRKGQEKHRPARPRNPDTYSRWRERNRAKLNAAAREYGKRNAPKVRAYSNNYIRENAEFYLAAKAVQRAIRHGVLPPAKECTCADCGRQAKHYHHESYAEQDRLNVTPLCVSCHKLRHTRASTV